jgi:hypothetical protein
MADVDLSAGEARSLSVGIAAASITALRDERRHR